MESNLNSLRHALDMWKRGQIEEDAMLVREGARAVQFWRSMQAAAEYKSKVTSQGTK